MIESVFALLMIIDQLEIVKDKVRANGKDH